MLRIGHGHNPSCSDRKSKDTPILTEQWSSQSIGINSLLVECNLEEAVCWWVTECDETPLIDGPVYFQQVIPKKSVMQQRIVWLLCRDRYDCLRKGYFVHGLIDPGVKFILWYTHTHTDIQKQTHTQTRRSTDTPTPVCPCGTKVQRLEEKKCFIKRLKNKLLSLLSPQTWCTQ